MLPTFPLQMAIACIFMYIIEGGYDGAYHEAWINIWDKRNYGTQTLKGFIYLIQNGYLDVNGLLDGANNGGLGEFGTCDVYINGSLVANDVNDFYPS